MAGAFQVRIDRDECTSCGVCWDACPEFFEENPDDGFTQVIGQYRVNDDLGLGEAPADLEDCITDAADGCPVEIIHVEET